LHQQRQLRFGGADARHDAIEVDQSYGFISGRSFLRAHLRAEPSEADLRYEPALDAGCAMYVRVLPG
jgi:hypothetical protein